MACTWAQAAPFTPATDAEVVERLPAATDPAVRGVESLRRQLAARPQDTDLRLDIARRYFDLAMAQGDPRYVGYATAALAPLAPAGPQDNAQAARYWLVRGLLQQYGHDFDAALASLAQAEARDPGAVEPVAWRAAIHMVQARYNEAAAACQRLAAMADPLFARGCSAYVQASTGQLRPAYEGLSSALAMSGSVEPGLALWLHTRLAEMATRLARYDEAEAHFKSGLATGITDQFLLAAYADFLIDRQRPRDALALLAGWERSDILLLRLALAARAAQDARAPDFTRQLRERFDAAAQRGDLLHEQEAARFALEVESDTAKALKLAQDNYAKQKEPRDAGMLLRAALAARQPQAAEPALAWLRRSGYEDAPLQKLAQDLGAVR